MPEAPSNKRIIGKNEDLSAVLKKFENDPVVLEELKKIEGTPELKRLYESIILNEDFAELRLKSNKQLEELERIYFGKFSVLGFRERMRKKSKLVLFQTMIDGLKIVRSDSGKFDKFKAPSKTGSVASYGPADVIAKSEDFVYASFSEIGHHMSQGANSVEIEKSGLTSSAQIIMNDVANVQARCQRGEPFIEKYLTNLFDFENGLKILAIYLAIIFDNPDEAKAMLSQSGGHPFHAQRWDEEGKPPYRSTREVGSREEFLHKQEEDLRKRDLFILRMKEILRTTGIEPPLSIEVRILGEALKKSN